MTKLLISTALTALALSASVAATAQPAPARAEVPTQLPRTARPIKYSIEIIPDAANMRFSGRTTIDVRVLSTTNSLTLNAADLEIGSATVAGQKATVRTDAAAQTATFTLPRALTPGTYKLDIAYTGKINSQASGLFALDYQSASGPKRALYAVRGARCPAHVPVLGRAAVSHAL